jgi:DNA-binding beta-propeller fold protein YncE
MATVGSGEHLFEANYDWAKLPEGWDAPMAAVAVDSQDRVYGFNRGERGIIVFDKDGNYLSHWDGVDFVFPHAIYADPSDNIWIVDRDAGQILKYTTDGELLMAVGERGYRSDTGADNSVYSSNGWSDVTHGGEPFNLPAGVAVAEDGSVFVADGYANCRVHKFTADGDHVKSWGDPGSGPGQFNLPHGVWIDSAGQVLVADRENDRVQVFDQEGAYISQWPSELIGPAVVWMDPNGAAYVAEHNGGFLSVLDSDGNTLARWGGPEFRSCHGAAGDSDGNIYFVQPVKGMSGRRIVKYVRK